MLALEITLKIYLEQNKMVYFHIGIQLTTGITCSTLRGKMWKHIWNFVLHPTMDIYI